MKFLVPVALATFATLASAHNKADKCDALEKKIPICAQPCVNGAAKQYCTPGDLDCGCAPKTIEKIIADSATCCVVGKPSATTTTKKPTPTPTCAAEVSKVPKCATACVNEEAYKICEKGDLKCGCAPENLEKIIKGSAECVAKACKDFGHGQRDEHDHLVQLDHDLHARPLVLQAHHPDVDLHHHQGAHHHVVPPTVTACPTGGHEVTETIVTTTTWCPETEVPAPTTQPGETETVVPIPTGPPAETETEAPVPTSQPGETQTEIPIPTGPPAETQTELPIPTSQPIPTQVTPGPGVPGGNSTVTSSPPPAVTAAAAMLQRSTGLVAGAVAVFAGFAWL
ncbi:hypothetical protein ACCO45_007729 [Purpureocillium lilacinum]|uniref:Uncharacterized protein n=1 Tax=Purpureocillium lilacinum TaxID=33203 RepID=A0ACC4DL95_PURLI